PPPFPSAPLFRPVPRRRILFPGISQSDDQFHQRRAALKARPFLLPPRFRVARKSGGKASPPPISTPMKKSKAQPKLRPRPIKNDSGRRLHRPESLFILPLPHRWFHPFLRPPLPLHPIAAPRR